MSEEDKSAFTLPSDDDSQSSSGGSAKKELKVKDGETVIDAERRKKRNKIIAWCALAVLLLAALVTAVVFFSSRGSDEAPTEVDREDGYVDIEGGTDGTPDGTDPVTGEQLEFYEEKPIPFETDDWQQVSMGVGEDGSIVAYDVQGKELTEDQIRDMVLSESIASSSSLWSAGGTLPSEEAGFTSDPDKELNEDGSLNPLFSYWTQEQFTYDLSIITESLLNPNFGGWDAYTVASANAKENFFINEHLATLFTEDYLANTAPSDFPVFADWQSNDYGLGDKLLPTPNSRFFGEITNSSTEFSFDEENGQYTADFQADVRFTAWTQDREKIEKTGKLTLGLVSNPNGENNSSSLYRVLVNSAQLVVE